MKIAAVVTHEPPWYVARLVGADVAAQGETAEEATENLKDAVATIGPVAVADEAPVLTSIEVPNAPAAPSVVDRETFVRDAAAKGWQVAERDGNVLLTSPDGAHVAVVPVGAREVAPGVFRMLAGRAVAGDREAALHRIDAIFARNGGLGDTTRLVREQRDAR